MDSTAEKRASPGAGRPIIVGEVLFDTFPDGTQVLGGAPFNVAWHLQGFGLAPLFISRVGAAAAGRRVHRTMTDWGMDTTGLQVDDRYPTGRVEIAIRDGHPDFSILADQAYDFIDADAAARAVSGADAALLYHGTLATRQEVSHDTLCGLRARGLPVFIDINLRAPWWTRARVEEFLAGGRWVKLNEDELGVLSGDAVRGPGDVERAAREFQRHYGVDLLIVTLGTEGALIVTGGRLTRGSPVMVDDVVDTVGAGDAFSAVMIYGLICGWRGEDTLDRAMHFAAAICRRRGATVADPALYREHQAAWAGAQKAG